MSAIDRALTDEAYDNLTNWLGTTYVYRNLGLSAEHLNASQTLEGLVANTGFSEDLNAFRDALSDNPQQSEAFRQLLIEGGGGFIDKVDTLLEQDGVVTADDVSAFIDAEYDALGDRQFDAIVPGRIDTPEEFFEFVTTDNYVVGFVAGQLENKLNMLRPFHDDAEFQQNLFDAAHQPGFFDALQALEEQGGAGFDIDTLMATEEGRDAIREAVATIAADDFDGDYAAAFGTVSEEVIAANFDTILDTIAEEHPEAAGLIESIKGDAEVSAALQNAIANDPTMLPGLQGMLSGAGEGAMSAADLQAILDNPAQRDMMINVLNAVAEDNGDLDVNFSHVRRLIEANKNNDLAAAQAVLGEIGVEAEGLAGFNAFEFIFEFLQDPGMAMTNLANDLVAAGQLNPEHANMLISFGTNVGGALINGSTIGAVYDVVQDHGGIGAIAQQLGDDLNANGANIAAQYGVTSFSAPAAPTEADMELGNIPDFNAAFDRALNGVDLNNTTAILDAMVAVDGEFTDEAGIIRTSTDLRSQFEAAMAGKTEEQIVEQAAGLRQAMERDGATVQSAMRATFG